MTIALAADHAGFELKEIVKKYLIERGSTVKDLGATEFNALDDYPDFIISAAMIISLASIHISDIIKMVGYLIISTE